jgi:DNA-binding transcriptional MerR regulator
VSDIIRIGEAATLLHVSRSTIRSWERRLGREIAPRSRGGHRHYPRLLVLCMRDALSEGVTGSQVITRAEELAANGRHSDPPILVERIARVELRLAHIERELVELTNEIRHRLPVAVPGSRCADVR